MIRFFTFLLSFYMCVFPALADGVCFAPHHHHHNEHLHVHCEDEHGVVGGLSGALMGGRGCAASGALGAMVGETLGCMMLEEPLSAQEQAVGGRILTKAEYDAVHHKAFDHYKQHIADVAKVAKIMTVMGSALTGLNVNVANQTAANALDHNFVHVAAFGLLMASAGYSSYCVYQAYQTDGALGALQQLGIEIAVNAAGVATGKFVVNMGGKVLQCEGVKQALDAAYKHTPGLQAALSALTPKLISAIEAFDKTALGKAVGRLENQLVHLEDKLFRRVFDSNTIKVREVQWGKGIKEQGMPFEDYMATKLPGGNKLIPEGGSRLPKNFKTFDYFDPGSKRAVSVKTLNTCTAARLENPHQIYGALKRNIDAIINFEYYERPALSLYSHEIASRELYLGIPHQTQPLQRGAIDRALDYAKINGIKVEIFHVY